MRGAAAVTTGMGTTRGCFSRRLAHRRLSALDSRYPRMIPISGRPVAGWRAPGLLLTAVLILVAGCQGRSRSQNETASPADPSSAPYQAETEEGLGAAVAILIDTSGSMDDVAPGDSRPKYLIARE